MKVIESSKIIYVDVDDTLVIWDWQQYTDNTDDLFYLKADDGCTIAVLPHKRHIEMIDQFKMRGHTIVVWSQGGWAWAKKVVEALGIESKVDVVMSKPDWYVDDLASSAFMKKNIYLHPFDKAKDQTSFEIPK